MAWNRIGNGWTDNHSYKGEMDLGLFWWEEAHNLMQLYHLDINEDCSKRDLEKIFSKYGHLREIWLASYAPFYAFINYESKSDMEVKILLEHC